MARLPDAHLKIKRANEHIADLEKTISSLPESDIATVEINPQGGNEVIKHDFGNPDVLTDLALIAGDAVHNLKCALDYTWLETISVLVPDAVSKFSKFPIYATKDKLEGALRGKKIDTACPDLFKLVVDEIKPYNGGDFAIWSVHRLDIRDKHRLLIPALHYSSVSGIETKNKSTGEISRDGFTMATNQPPPLCIPMPLELHVEKKGKVSVSVMFEHGEPEREFRMADTLKVYSHFIVEVVKRFERFLT
jgi:hypothetical protein